jgi:hypothetical protein
VSPALLVLSLLCLPLPWVEVRCVSSNTTVLRQSGLQATYGGYSVPGAEGPTAEKPEQGDESKDAGKAERLPPAPLVGAYALLALLGAVAGWAVGDHGWRLALVAALAFAATAALVGQVARGFPIEQGASDNQGRSRPPPPPSQPPPAGRIWIALEVRYTPWLWTALALTAAAGVTAGTELWVTTRRATQVPAPPD